MHLSEDRVEGGLSQPAVAVHAGEGGGGAGGEGDDVVAAYALKLQVEDLQKLLPVNWRTVHEPHCPLFASAMSQGSGSMRGAPVSHSIKIVTALSTLRRFWLPKAKGAFLYLMISVVNVSEPRST